jgi:hypothetical protein
LVTPAWAPPSLSQRMLQLRDPDCSLHWQRAMCVRGVSAGAGRRGCTLRKHSAPGAPEAEAPQQAAVPELARELVAARLAEAEALRRLR